MRELINNKRTLSYLITVSRAHLLPAQMLLMTLTNKTQNEIVVVGNLLPEEALLLKAYGVKYIDENNINYASRLPNVIWTEKFRKFGWYKQMFVRLCIDKFMKTDEVVILDSEVFVFDNWDENNFYDPVTHKPRSFYWMSKKRKPDWDYQMYKGAAYLLNYLAECRGIMEYANSDNYKRHISGVVLFSTQNVARLWYLLEKKTDLYKNLDLLFNHEKELAFSDHDFYGLAAEYGLFDDTVPVTLHANLLGWYDNHNDENFAIFKKSAMWSMCQKYEMYKNTKEYYDYMNRIAKQLKRELPKKATYWNKKDLSLIDKTYESSSDIRYFVKYQRQLDYTFRKRFITMYRALSLLLESGKPSPVIVEVGTLRDDTKGGGHSTYKFAEYCAKFGGEVHTVDIWDKAIEYSMKATRDYQPWIQYHISDSTEFLQQFEGEIDLLYLDGFDSTPGKEKEASEKQLKEIQAALPKLSKSCIVLLDDTDLPEGGKAGLSSKFLLANGFKLEINSYQQLYVRAEKDAINKKSVKKTSIILNKIRHGA